MFSNRQDILFAGGLGEMFAPAFGHCHTAWPVAGLFYICFFWREKIKYTMYGSVLTRRFCYGLFEAFEVWIHDNYHTQLESNSALARPVVMVLLSIDNLPEADWLLCRWWRRCFPMILRFRSQGWEPLPFLFSIVFPKRWWIKPDKAKRVNKVSTWTFRAIEEKRVASSFCPSKVPRAWWLALGLRRSCGDMGGIQLAVSQQKDMDIMDMGRISLSPGQASNPPACSLYHDYLCLERAGYGRYEDETLQVTLPASNKKKVPVCCNQTVQLKMI